jgi:hypothetical protein
MLEHLQAEPLGIFKSSLPVKRNSLTEQFHGHTISLFAVRIAAGLAQRNGINGTVKLWLVRLHGKMVWRQTVYKTVPHLGVRSLDVRPKQIRIE